MVRKASRSLSVAVLIILAASALAQSVPIAPFPPPPPPPPPNGPAAVLPAPVPLTAPPPASPEPMWRPAVTPLPPPGAVGDGGVCLPGGPALPDPPSCPPPGFFGALEIGVFAPQFHNGLAAPVTVAGNTHTVAVPGTPLDWTGSPRFVLGYRLANGAGAFTVSYRSLVAQGSSTLANFDTLGAGFVQSRLNANIVDLDYSVMPFSVAPFWDLSWSAGVRIGTVYYDSQVTGRAAEQRASNNFVSGGPHAGIELARQLDVVPGLALFGRLEGAVLIGEITQNFEETQTLFGGQVGGATHLTHGQAVPVLTFITGVSYAPPAHARWLRFTLGYQFEQWWDLGNLNGSHGDLTYQGFIFRGEFTF